VIKVALNEMVLLITNRVTGFPTRAADLESQVFGDKSLSPKIPLSLVKYFPFLVIPLFAVTLVIAKCQTTNNLPVNHIKLKINTAPLGQKVSPEQRRTFALNFKKGVKTDFKNATITTTGDFHATFLIESDDIKSKMIYPMIAGLIPLSDLRGLGFKQVKISNGREVWEVDLRN
jgi:hypothetical protein